MESYLNSPVPIEQRPSDEFTQLTNSLFFSWPTKSINNFIKKLFLTWIISFPFFIIISTGSYTLRLNIFNLISLSFLSSIIIPILILLRQLWGWDYVYKRLLSKTITYEESDWHDGKDWEKPSSWLLRDKLIASQEVLPIISKIKTTTKYLLILFIFLLTSYFFYIRIN
ncbi:MULTISPECIES: CGLD27 family protein [Prochlorococcus]|uniref:Uncharacterized membrane protein n=1 Tax=Prochlorococcus marinus (strain SARG / CCMP1375 / SS120) TaxID=167539 RepID=Q7VC48_PROMA|nr:MULTISPECIES: CGLD27 family protein [Prochlorococcus]AAP99938.1 Uncharacterized membrane protein [Prochlorococcus marinus subsp. marinus str. CCMP1375]KGG11716.1 putative membrane protein Ycf36 [Prochlorococcus marinus str. LG]KGG18871.1 putative membrane protein Ycf36 [Prochlorococcus marinus str. SS2]KGG23591.1 putative membrane protein Ycf36 [Prochlorococcus marinus str. SS35]KGG32173.1 putative membrane protein Ycf36 [Prochlorococcus marinus str. SS51]